jgi:hypothetical protein
MKTRMQPAISAESFADYLSVTVTLITKSAATPQVTRAPLRWRILSAPRRCAPLHLVRLYAYA